MRPRRRRRDWRRLVVSALVGLALAAIGVSTVRDALQPSAWQRVFATREGEIGKRTATGLVIQSDSAFVALPHRLALHKHVEIRYRQRVMVVPVLDVGPWNVDDDYWVDSRRPASERGVGRYRTPVNRAGIDLSDPVFATLGLRTNDWVEWRFVHKGYLALPWL